jgi:hypothetical protein
LDLGAVSAQQLCGRFSETATSIADGVVRSRALQGLPATLMPPNDQVSEGSSAHMIA